MRNGGHREVADSDRVLSYELPTVSQAPQFANGLNEHSLSISSDIKTTEIGGIDGTTTGVQRNAVVHSHDDHPIAGMQMEPLHLSVQTLANSGMAAYSASPVLTMGYSMRDTMFQLSQNNWGYDLALANPQGFQNQPSLMDLIPSPMQQPNQPQIIQSQTMPNVPSIPVTLPVVQRPPCTWCMESFTRASDLQRHIESVHLGIKYHCFWIGCHNNRGKGYCRAEKLRTHQRQKHGFA